MQPATDAIVIRRAGPADAPALAVLGASTFTATFGLLYPPEDLREYLAAAHSTGWWQGALADPERAVWMACDGGAAVGYLVAGACKLPVAGREPTAGEIQQLYLLAPYQNRRLGTRLMDAALAWLEAGRRLPAYVGVWSGNHGAQRFYGRYGFRKVGDYGFPVGRTIDHEFILKRLAVPG